MSEEIYTVHQTIVQCISIGSPVPPIEKADTLYSAATFIKYIYFCLLVAAMSNAIESL